MLTWNTLSGTNIVEVVYNGDIQPNEIDGLRAALTAAVAASGSAKLLVEVGKNGGMPPKSLIDELSGEQLISQLGRSAVLIDKTILRMMVTAGAKMAPMEVKVYKTAERDEALTWLTSGD